MAKKDIYITWTVRDQRLMVDALDLINSFKGLGYKTLVKEWEKDFERMKKKMVKKGLMND